MATIKSYRDLVCWQLAAQIRREMIAITDRPKVQSNFKFCQQVGESTRSAPANIAEGFKRTNRVFMQYLDIALGSLQETENHVDEALERKYITEDEHAHFRMLAKRAIRAAEELRAYLGRCSPPPPARARKDGRGADRPVTRERTRTDPTNLPEPDNPTNPTNLTNQNQPSQPDQPDQPDQPEPT